jgi:SAM-dependent methyltransferase
MHILKNLFFRLWYLRKPPWETNQTPPELIEFIESNPPGRALDLGCGTGTNVIKLAQHGWQVIGVDFVPKAIRTARKKAHRAGVDVQFVKGDVTRLENIKGPFDFILDIGCYHSLDSSGMRAYRERVRQLLADQGTYMIYLFFRPIGGSSKLTGSQAAEADLEPFLEFLDLEKREEGSERGIYRSAWLTYLKKPIPEDCGFHTHSLQKNSREET